MLEMTTLCPTVQIDETLNIRARLQQQRQWQMAWEEKDRALEAFIVSVDDRTPEGKQLGLQATTERIQARLELIREPLEIDVATIERTGYSTLRRMLDSQFAALTAAERKQWLWNFLFIMTPDLRRLYDKIARVRSYRSFGQQRNFLLGGPSGMGKTTCLDWFVFNHPSVVESARNRVPIVKINAPYSNASAHRLLRQIILRCGRTYLKGDTEADLLDKVILYFQKCAVEVLIVDEIQHLRTHGMRRRLLEISNENQGIPIICASCNPVEFVRGDLEIAGRWNDHFELKSYTGKRLEELLAFIELLLPFTQPSHLAIRHWKEDKADNEGPAAFIERCTGGILRDVMILITDASLQAIERDEPILTVSRLRESWANIQENGVEDFLQLMKTNNEGGEKHVYV